MNFSEYLPLALRTEKPLPTLLARYDHAVMGLITETGEIASDVKRLVYYGAGLDEVTVKRPVSIRSHLREEMGDFAWYLALLYDITQQPPTHHQRPTPHRIGAAFAPGTVSASAELADALKEMAFFMSVNNGLLLQNAWSVRHNAVENIVDIAAKQLNAFVVVCNLLDFDPEDILQENVDKLSERFPSAFTEEAAEARADKGGLDAHNS